MKILVVDDNPQNQYLLEVLLGGHGYEVTVAHNGAEALEEALQDRFDLIISDILMPQMDGFQLCRAVKANRQLQDVPFVFYSATYTEPQDQEFALSLGANKFVLKPQDPRVLLAIVQDVIHQRTAGRLVTPPPEVEEAVYIKVYNERLIHKLEEKMLEVEEAHDRLAESEAQYRALVDQANDAVLMLDPGGRVRFVNPKFCTWFGYGQEEATRLHLRSLIHPDDADRVLASFQSLMSGAGLPVFGELRCLTKTGDIIYADINANSIVRDGILIGAQATLRDIAERKRLEAQLQQATRLEAIGTLAGGIAHDFNNILSVILGYTEISCEALPKDSPVWRNLQKVLSAALRAKGLIQRVLEFSRQTEEERQPVRLHHLIHEALALLQPTLPSTIEVQRQIMTETATVLAIPTQLHQVLVNLCTNAEHAMRPMGGILEIGLDSVEVHGALATAPPGLGPGLYARLTVRDTGHGMTSEVMERLFDPFFTTKEVGQGTGLGLATVHKIITGYQGVITVTSIPGQGTTFEVYLPQTQETTATIDR
jgi:PAS domain S-box-containing protein